MVKNKFSMVILTFVLLLISSSAYAQDLIQQDEYYRDLAKTHFDLAVKQFDEKDLFAACSNLRISMGYARHINDKIIYEHITLLLDKMCSGDS